MSTEPQKREFSAPEDLTDDWIIEHSKHGLMWSVHTVFKGNRGIKYRECMCYKCRKIARLELESVHAERQPVPPKESRKHRVPKKSNFNTIIL